MKISAYFVKAELNYSSIEILSMSINKVLFEIMFILRLNFNTSILNIFYSYYFC